MVQWNGLQNRTASGSNPLVSSKFFSFWFFRLFSLHSLVFSAIKIKDIIYVLHSFTKKSKKTPKGELKITTERLKNLEARIRQEGRDGESNKKRNK